MRITLESKMALIAIVLYNSTEEQQEQYVDDTNLVPSYHLTPETTQELLENGLIDTNHYPTKKGIWFANLGTSDSPPAFTDFVRGLSINALHSLVLHSFGSLVKRHQTTLVLETKLKIERILKQVYQFAYGDNKSLEQVLKDYEPVEKYNKNKK